jgi:hypothetical protein
MKKEMKIIGLLGILIIFLVIAQVSALDEDRERRINFGHVMIIDKITMDPEYIAPGEAGTVIVKIKNNANAELYDVRAQLNLPEEFKFLNRVSKIKIGKIYPNETIDMIFDVISTPNADEGMYNATITVDYVNHIGDERQDIDEFGILVIKGEPKIFATVDSAQIYKGHNIGEVTLTFVNNNLADLKFLTVEILDSDDYKILSADKEYVGDLDSDDFESVDFKLKVDNKKIIPLKLKLTYMDALNKEYSEEINVDFKILSAGELGIKSNNTAKIIFVVLVGGGIGYYFYKKHKKKKRKEAKFK